MLDAAATAHRLFSQSLRALTKARIPYHDRAPEIPQRSLDKCRLLQSRTELVKLLPKNGIVAEIGNAKGAFVRYVLDASKPKQLHLFKRDVSRIDNENIPEGLRRRIITIHDGDPVSLMSAILNDYFDWIDLNNAHSYEDVRKHIDTAAAKVKPSGYLVFNDYTVWSPLAMNHCGVSRAVNEFCIASGWEVIFLALQSMMYNDVALRKPIQ